MTGNTSQRWGSVQIALHWAIAALLLVQVPVGLRNAGRARGRRRTSCSTCTRISD